MLVRIVKLTFKLENIASFKSIFDKHKIAIQNIEGCTFLELLQDVDDERIFFTHSYWNSSADLEKYRNSEYFRNVWKTTKLLFAEKPEAWSLQKVNVNKQSV
ncbi:Heme oxygenase (staphylobilin-producing) [Arenibacter antarcticus]|uniref:Quinol monooxygenase n=1 Tax=Arenibacter antarcticus TaxID=2040469 RepID=A0ABW5VFJ5_9FLAO|nr:antibiotic biosynthesis monooxygenase [Arenibacter sp. H213]MCM4166124.1 antibiotic biosynthesis monooxygenase [Arenibacter sp. H213]